MVSVASPGWYVMTYLSAVLIGLSAVFLLLGIRAIKTRKVQTHKKFMLSASLLALLFIINYILKSALFPPKTYQGEFRDIYILTLTIHMILAFLNVPFAIFTIYLSLIRKNFSLHKKVARITAPLWISVAITGWIVFFFIIQ